MAEYRIGSKDYLARAKARILDGTPESIFYAAFELRCFLEARQGEYLEAQERYAKSFPKQWETSKQWKALQEIAAGERLQNLKFVFQDGWMLDAHYVPVSRNLLKQLVRMSELVHAQSEFRSIGHAWWADIRRQLLDTYRSAWICRQGNLLSPALIVGDGIRGNIMLDDHEEDADELQRRFAPHQVFTLHCTYSENPPEAWVPDL